MRGPIRVLALVLVVFTGVSGVFAASAADPCKDKAVAAALAVALTNRAPDQEVRTELLEGPAVRVYVRNFGSAVEDIYEARMANSCWAVNELRVLKSATEDPGIPLDCREQAIGVAKKIARINGVERQNITVYNTSNESVTRFGIWFDYYKVILVELNGHCLVRRTLMTDPVVPIY